MRGAVGAAQVVQTLGDVALLRGGVRAGEQEVVRDAVHGDPEVRLGVPAVGGAEAGSAPSVEISTRAVRSPTVQVWVSSSKCASTGPLT